MIIRLSDIRACKDAHTGASKYCTKGARQWFSDHDLNWGEFLQNGIDSSRLEQFDDIMAKDVIEVANGRKI